MNLAEHLAFVIGLVEKGESPAKVKASLVAMSEEVSGYEQAASKAIKLAEKQSPVDTAPTPEFLELKKAVMELKQELKTQKTKVHPSDSESIANSLAAIARRSPGGIGHPGTFRKNPPSAS